MTIEEAKRRAELYSALAEGKTIQVLIKDDEWKDIKIDELKHLQDYYKYRIKPEPRYRPFETKEECWNEMLKHQPFGWIKQKENEGKIVHIGCIFEVRVRPKVLITLSCDEENITNSSYLFHAYTFTDNTPFGIKEE